MKVLLRAALIASALLLFASPAGATQSNDGVCTGLDSGKIDVVGSHKSVTVTAPAGYLIDGYCVKAGSIQQGNGPEYVDVDPPVASITFEHSSGKDISHYAVSYVTIPSTTTTSTLAPTTTTTVTSTTSTLPTSTTTTVADPSTTTTLPDDDTSTTSTLPRKVAPPSSSDPADPPITELPRTGASGALAFFAACLIGAGLLLVFRRP